MPSSFLFDPNRCTGCQACRFACTVENALEPDTSWREIATFNPRRHPAAPVYHLSLACHHCERPVCLDACPALAIARDEATGTVQLDPGRCIGCRYCAWACPYGAPRFDAPRGVMTKCTLCAPRLLEGRKPACAAGCPTGALDFGEAGSDGCAAPVAGVPDTDLGPALRIAPLRPDRSVPEMTAPPPMRPFVEPSTSVPLGHAVRLEWPLILFTVAAALLAAVPLASSIAPPVLSPAAFAAAVVLAGAVAALHLGRPSRAYRALLNVRRSPLSREAVAMAGFAVATTVSLGAGAANRPLGLAAAVLGLVALVSIDRVYAVLPGARPPLRHSAAVLWTGLLLAGLLAEHVWLAALPAVAKLLLYLDRKASFLRDHRPLRLPATLARLGLGFLLPAVLWTLAEPVPIAWILAAVLVGELLDRTEFYAELEPPAPRREMVRALEAALTADANSGYNAPSRPRQRRIESRDTGPR